MRDHDRFMAMVESPMTVVEVQECVDIIRALAHDDETAHGLEDCLRGAVLRDIARGTGGPETAALALSTANIAFSRRYA